MANLPFSEQIVDRIIQAGYASVKGGDIFFNELPDDSDIAPNTMTVIKDTGGVPSPNTPERERSIQVLVRTATSWYIAHAKAMSIFDFFHGSVGLTTTNYRLVSGLATQLPYDLGVDERGRYRVSFNLVFDVVNA